MIDIRQYDGALTEAEQSVVSDGFLEHSNEHSAPPHIKVPMKWIGTDDGGEIVGVLAVESVWDWMYIDELWVASGHRGQGIGKYLMQQAEECAQVKGLQGIWLWTQSWQAEGFYLGLGYQEFCRFPNFPKDHERIGLRKVLAE